MMGSISGSFSLASSTATDVSDDGSATDAADAPELAQIEALCDLEHPTAKERFKLRRQIGEGAFGRIYAADIKLAQRGVGGQEEANHQVAIKVLPIEKHNEHSAAKLLAELRALRAVSAQRPDSDSQSSFVAFFGAFLVPKRSHGQLQLWFVQELCELGSLQAVLKKRKQPAGCFTEKEVAAILQQVVKGLRFLHDSVRAVHRDLKADNLLWNRDGSVKISDLGEIVFLTDAEPMCNEMAGTPYFLAPEVATGEDYDGRADIWALGITACELATGEPPLMSFPPMQALCIIAEDLEPPNQLPTEGFSEDFVSFVNENCLVRDVDMRPTAELLSLLPFIQEADPTVLVAAAQEYALLASKLLAAEAESKTADSEASLVRAGAAAFREGAVGLAMQQFSSDLRHWLKDNRAMFRSRDAPGTMRRSSSAAIVLRSSRAAGAKSAKWKRKLEELDSLVSLAHACADDRFGVIVRDRDTSHGHFDRCVRGKDLVDWLYSSLQLPSRATASMLAQALVQAELLLCLSSRDSVEVDSLNEYYRFNYVLLRDWAPVQERTRSLTRVNSDRVAAAALSEDAVLTDHDWDLLLAGAAVESYSKDQAIIAEGDHNEFLYRIKAGTAIVEKRDENRIPKAVATLGPGAHFGEISILSRSPASATIRAGRSPTEVWRADTEFLNTLLESEPVTMRRFFRLLALTLAQLLRKKGNPQAPKVVAPEKGVTISIGMDDYAQLNSPCAVRVFFPPSATVKDALSIIRLKNSVNLKSVPADELASRFALFRTKADGGRRLKDLDELMAHIVRDNDRLVLLDLRGGHSRPVHEQELFITSRSGDSERELSDTKDRELFGLPDDEKIIGQYPCFDKGVIRAHGTLYVFRRHLCWYSKVFSRTQKRVVPLRRVTDVSFVGKHGLKFLARDSKKRKIKFTVDGLASPETVSELVLSLRESAALTKHPSKISKSRSSASSLNQGNTSLARLGAFLDLTDEDWALLLEGAECSTFQPGEVIIAQNSESRRLWYLASGSCRVECLIVKDEAAELNDSGDDDDGDNGAPFKNVRVGSIGAGVLFGEIGYLAEIPATASVVADSPDTVVYGIVAERAEVLFFRAPAVAARFYRFMALTVSMRLRS